MIKKPVKAKVNAAENTKPINAITDSAIATSFPEKNAILGFNNNPELHVDVIFKDF